MKTEELIKKIDALTRKQKVRAALFTAELVLPVYEYYFPSDSRPRLAVEKGKAAAAVDDADAAAAYAAAYAAYAAAVDDAYAAAYAAYAAADAAYAATDAADAIRRGILAGAKKKTIGLFIDRL